MTVENPGTVRQIVPMLVASLIGVTFGTMLGWPSLAFPLLVDKENTPVLITWNLSAALAGCLMWGNIMGTFFSSTTFLGSKPGILAGCILQIVGWIIMYNVETTIELAFSRLFVGFGNGFAMGQLKIYSQETCEPRITKAFMQYMTLSVNVGIIIVYVFGFFASFRQLSLYCMIFPGAAVILFGLIPKRPYVQFTNEKAATITETKEEQPTQEKQVGFIEGFKDKKIRKCFFILWFLIFIPQYTGGAANIVYNQVVHMAALNPYPKTCGVIYAFAFLFSNFVALKYVHKFPRKPVLVASCIISSLILCAVCFYFYFMVDLLEVSKHFVWSPLVLLSIFNFFHTLGTNTVPILYISDQFPKNAQLIGTKFHVMYYSLSALLATKVYQVFFTYYQMHSAYAFNSGVAFTCGLIVLFFIKEPSESRISNNLQGFENNVDLYDENPCDKKDVKDRKPSYELKNEIMNDRNNKKSRDDARKNRFETIEVCVDDEIVPYRNSYQNQVDLSDEDAIRPVISDMMGSDFSKTKTTSNDKIGASQNNTKVNPKRKLYQNNVNAKDDIMTRF